MENKTLIEMAHKGDKRARDILVQENIGLVWSIVKRFGNRGFELEDLFQFSTYAVPLIMGEIKRFIRDDGLVKISRTIKENNWKIKRASQELAQRLGREATIEEISKETGLNTEDIVQAMEAISDVESIYKSVYQNDGSEIYLIDRIKALESSGESVDRIINNMVVEQVLNELDEIERNIIIMRYFQDKTQSEIAKKLGISQVQVSRMEKKILFNLKKKILA